MSIASFSEERFPLRVAFGTSGGPERRVEIVRLSTGFEHRNQRSRHAVRRYDAGSGIRSLGDLTAVVAFFEARRGKLVGFRFRDPIDGLSPPYGQVLTPFDQTLGTGDGATTVFQLVKRYGSGDDAYERPIQKPIAGSIRVGVGGAEMTTGHTIDATMGRVTFDVPPSAGAIVSAGFAFDVPVRFDIDQLSVNVAAFEAGQIPSIPLIEVRV